MKKARFLFFVGLVFLFAFAPQANALVETWDYSISALFTSASWEDNSTTAPNSTSLSWGDSSPQSSLVINPSAVNGQVATYTGGGLPDSSYWGDSISLTHNNFPIPSTSNSLTGAVLTVYVTLDPYDPDNPALPDMYFWFDIEFAETPNASPNPNDVFALPGGFPNFDIIYDAGDVDGPLHYFVNVFPTGDNVLSALNAAYAALAGVPTGTQGFTTIEGASTTMNFSFSISTEAIPDTVVPEPSTLLLLGFGIAGLAGIARRKMTRK